MTALLIKNIPAELHRKLKSVARRHHRSMNQQVIAILEKNLGEPAFSDIPPPFKLRKRLTSRWVCRVIRNAREGRA